MRVEASQFRVGVARTSVRERPSGCSLVKDVDSDSVKSDSLSESLFGGGLDVVRDVVERRSGGSQLVGFVVEALRRAKYKFAGRQRIGITSKWGFTKIEKKDLS